LEDKDLAVRESKVSHPLLRANFLNDTPVILECLQQITVARSPFVYCPPNSDLGGFKLNLGGQLQLGCLLDAMYGITGPDVNRETLYTTYFIMEIGFDGLNPDLHGGTVQQWCWLQIELGT
jgi:hypothetical protein